MGRKGKLGGATMSANGAASGSRGKATKDKGGRYFTSQPGNESKMEEMKMKMAPAASGGNKRGRKRKGGPEDEARSALTDAPEMKKGRRKQQKEEQMKAKREEDGKASDESKDEEKHGEDEVDGLVKVTGSARYRAALTLRNTFQNFVQPEDDDDDDDEDGSEEDGQQEEEKFVRRMAKVGRKQRAMNAPEEEFISLNSEDDESQDEDADGNGDDDEDDGHHDDEEGPGHDDEADSGAAGGEGRRKAATRPAKRDKRTQKAKRKPIDAETLAEAGAVYLGHLPHGFFKEGMKSFFSQFGKVLLISHPLSKKSGRSKGYAFILFRHKEVAQIVADTMSGYLMYGRILKCKYIPPDQITKNMFKRAHLKYPKFNNGRKREERKSRRIRTPEEHQTLIESLVSREARKRNKLRKLGIDYEFPGYAAASASAKSGQ